MLEERKALLIGGIVGGCSLLVLLLLISGALTLCIVRYWRRRKQRLQSESVKALERLNSSIVLLEHDANDDSLTSTSSAPTVLTPEEVIHIDRPTLRIEERIGLLAGRFPTPKKLNKIAFHAASINSPDDDETYSYNHDDEMGDDESSVSPFEEVEDGDTTKLLITVAPLLPSSPIEDEGDDDIDVDSDVVRDAISERLLDNASLSQAIDVADDVKNVHLLEPEAVDMDETWRSVQAVARSQLYSLDEMDDAVLVQNQIFAVLHSCDKESDIVCLNRLQAQFSSIGNSIGSSASHIQQLQAIHRSLIADRGSQVKVPLSILRSNIQSKLEQHGKVELEVIQHSIQSIQMQSNMPQFDTIQATIRQLSSCIGSGREIGLLHSLIRMQAVLSNETSYIIIIQSEIRRDRDFIGEAVPQILVLQAAMAVSPASNNINQIQSVCRRALQAAVSLKQLIALQTCILSAQRFREQELLSSNINIQSCIRASIEQLTLQRKLYSVRTLQTIRIAPNSDVSFPSCVQCVIRSRNILVKANLCSSLSSVTIQTIIKQALQMQARNSCDYVQLIQASVRRSQDETPSALQMISSLQASMNKGSYKNPIALQAAIRGRLYLSDEVPIASIQALVRAQLTTRIISNDLSSQATTEQFTIQSIIRSASVSQNFRWNRVSIFALQSAARLDSQTCTDLYHCLSRLQASTRSCTLTMQHESYKCKLRVLSSVCRRTSAPQCNTDQIIRIQKSVQSSVLHDSLNHDIQSSRMLGAKVKAQEYRTTNELYKVQCDILSQHQVRSFISGVVNVVALQSTLRTFNSLTEYSWVDALTIQNLVRTASAKFRYSTALSATVASGSCRDLLRKQFKHATVLQTAWRKGAICPDIRQVCSEISLIQSSVRQHCENSWLTSYDNAVRIQSTVSMRSSECYDLVPLQVTIAQSYAYEDYRITRESVRNIQNCTLGEKGKQTKDIQMLQSIIRLASSQDLIVPLSILKACINSSTVDYRVAVSDVIQMQARSRRIDLKSLFQSLSTLSANIESSNVLIDWHFVDQIQSVIQTQNSRNERQRKMSQIESLSSTMRTMHNLTGSRNDLEVIQAASRIVSHDVMHVILQANIQQVYQLNSSYSQRAAVQSLQAMISTDNRASEHSYQPVMLQAVIRSGYTPNIDPLFFSLISKFHTLKLDLGMSKIVQLQAVVMLASVPTIQTEITTMQALIRSKFFSTSAIEQIRGIQVSILPASLRTNGWWEQIIGAQSNILAAPETQILSQKHNSERALSAIARSQNTCDLQQQILNVDVLVSVAKSQHMQLSVNENKQQLQSIQSVMRGQKRGFIHTIAQLQSTVRSTERVAWNSLPLQADIRRQLLTQEFIPAITICQAHIIDRSQISELRSAVRDIQAIIQAQFLASKIIEEYNERIANLAHIQAAVNGAIIAEDALMLGKNLDVEERISTHQVLQKLYTNDNTGEETGRSTDTSRFAEDQASKLIRKCVQSKEDSLDLSKLNLSRLPDELRNCKHLKSLNLGDNELNMLPDWFGDTFKNVTELNMSHNRLFELPENFSQLKKLKTLDLSFNKFEYFPLELTEMGIENLNMSNNSLLLLQSDISQMSNLMHLDVSNNNLMTLPDELTELKKLKAIAIDNNKFLQSEIGKITSILAPLMRTAQDKRGLVNVLRSTDNLGYTNTPQIKGPNTQSYEDFTDFADLTEAIENYGHYEEEDTDDTTDSSWIKSDFSSSFIRTPNRTPTDAFSPEREEPPTDEDYDSDRSISSMSSPVTIERVNYSKIPVPTLNLAQHLRQDLDGPLSSPRSLTPTSRRTSRRSTSLRTSKIMEYEKRPELSPIYQMLLDEDIRSKFRAFCEEQSAGEIVDSVDFWTAALQFKIESDIGNKKDKAAQIFYEYFDPNTARKVSVPPFYVEKLKQQLEDELFRYKHKQPQLLEDPLPIYLMSNILSVLQDNMVEMVEKFKMSGIVPSLADFNTNTIVPTQEKPDIIVPQTAYEQSKAYRKSIALDYVDRDTLKELRNLKKEQKIDYKERISVLFEFLESERKYVKYLHVLHQMYYDPIIENRNTGEKQGIFKKRLVSEKSANQMFPPNFKAIMAFNQSFLKKLEQRFGIYQDKDPVSIYFMIISDLFIKIAPNLDVYVSYLAHYESASTAIRNYRAKHKNFDSWLNKRKRNKQSCGLDMGSLLIMPVQRIPRYKILLENLLKVTPVDHGDYDTLRKAIEIISDAASKHNEQIRETNNLMKVQQIAKMLKMDDLPQPKRFLIREGNCSMGENKQKAYLFTDILILREKKKLALVPTVRTYSLHNAVITGGRADSISLQLNSLKTSELKDKNLDLVFDSYITKNAWLVDFAKTIDGLDQDGRRDSAHLRPLTARSLRDRIRRSVTFSGRKRSSSDVSDKKSTPRAN